MYSANYSSENLMNLLWSSTGYHSLVAPSPMELTPISSSSVVVRKYVIGATSETEISTDPLASMAIFLPSYYLGRRQQSVWESKGTSSYSMGD